MDDISQGREEKASAADLFQRGERDVITAYPFESMPKQEFPREREGVKM